MKKINWSIVLVLIVSAFNSYSQNLLANGDFESGGNGVGFSINSSLYTELSAPFSGNTSPGNYAVTTNPQPMNTASFISGGDHTSGLGKMLVVDGTSSGGQQRFWRAGNNGGGVCSLNLTTKYTFSYWVKSVSNLVTNTSTRAEIKIIFNNASNITLVSGSALAPLPAQGWQQVVYTFTATNQCVNIEIYDNNVNSIGNDFAVDDFSLTAPPSPLTVSNSKLNPTCPDVSDATIVAYPNGGLAPYTYALAGTSTATNSSGIFQGLSEGTYTVTVTDSNTPPSSVTTPPILIVSPLNITLSPSSTGCNIAGTTITLTAANGGSTYNWSASTLIPILDTDAVVVVNPQVNTTYTVTSTTSSLTNPNLIGNGDFESGTSGFFSDYGYSTSNTSGAQFAYGVVSNPKNWFGDFVDSTDHSGSGMMLVADGATNSNKVIWSQSLPIDNNKQYTFSFWAQNLVANSPAQFKVLINGVQIVTSPISATNGSTSGWTKITGTWDSNNASIATIKIIDDNIASGGNDFAIDDISFSTPTPKTCNLSTQLTVTIGGAVPITDFSYTTPVCKNGTNPTPTPATGFVIGGVYSESTGLLSINSSTGEINLSASPTGNYKVRYSIAENSVTCQLAGSSTFDITIDSIVTAPGVTPINYCINTSATALSATASSGATLNWYGVDETGGVASSTANVPSTTTVGLTKYYVSQSIGVCESSRAAIAVTIVDLAIPIFTGIPVSICLNSTVSNLPSTSTNSIKGIWNPAIINNVETTKYTFIPDSGQCATNTETTIVVNSNVVPIFSPIDPICSGSLISPLPTTSSNNISGLWSPSLDNISTKIYTFTPDSGQQCVTTQTLTIVVNSVPEFTISRGCVETDYVLNVKQSNSNNLVYSWRNSSDEIIGNESSIKITQKGNYSIEVKEGDCKAIQDDIEINNVYCAIQKGISPSNGINDGRNDTFDLSNYNVYKLEIFNRYGVKVYSKSNYKKEWNGLTDSGQELPDATYYYVVEFESGKSKTGWVYLNRQN